MPLTMDSMMALPQEELPAFAAALHAEEVAQLVSWLALKEDDVRYRAFLLLREKSRADDGVYPYFALLSEKLRSDNSYQRSLGVMLIAENVKWDAAGKMRGILPLYLKILCDEKPVTVRQCIASLGVIAAEAPEYAPDIAKALLGYDVMQVRETMRKLILTDIVTVLAAIKKARPDPEIDAYLLSTLSGEILDGKAKKSLQRLL
ncbi:MAG TPA: hypothetical protein VN446_00105 [Candidatus Acidoferrum sp.]|nr:hypothetical protein [Candidatus Acidoferrum sp.]